MWQPNSILAQSPQGCWTQLKTRCTPVWDVAEGWEVSQNHHSGVKTVRLHLLQHSADPGGQRGPDRLCTTLFLAKHTLRIHRMGAHKHTKHTRAAKPRGWISSRLHLFATWCVSVTLSHQRIHHMALSLTASSWTLHYVSLLSGRAPCMLHSAGANKYVSMNSYF